MDWQEFCLFHICFHCHSDIKPAMRDKTYHIIFLHSVYKSTSQILICCCNHMLLINGWSQRWLFLPDANLASNLEALGDELLQNCSPTSIPVLKGQLLTSSVFSEVSASSPLTYWVWITVFFCCCCSFTGYSQSFLTKRAGVKAYSFCMCLNKSIKFVFDKFHLLKIITVFSLMQNKHFDLANWWN